MAHTNDVQLVENDGWDERILVCRNGQLVDTFIVVTERYVVVVDTMINPETAVSLLAHARPFLNDGRQLLVINTHADYDHAWGNQIFAGAEALHPAPTIGSRLSLPLFRDPDVVALLEEFQGQEPSIFGDVVLTPPTILVDERLLIDGGDLTLELFATPGHTPDHLSLYIPEISTLLAADAAELPFPFARAVACLPHMRKSLARLAAFNADVALYCHAPVTTGPQLLHDNIAYFDLLERKCRAALAQGVPASPGEDEDVAVLVGCSLEAAVPRGAHWQDVDDYFRTDGHAAQLRMMLEWLGGQE
ncbi:MAG: MBL fold metallo-hydrolase [Anaerolineae bacterium]